MSKELKTCPFCGERAVMKAVNKELRNTGSLFGVSVENVVREPRDIVLI